MNPISKIFVCGVGFVALVCGSGCSVDLQSAASDAVSSVLTGAFGLFVQDLFNAMFGL